MSSPEVKWVRSRLKLAGLSARALQTFVGYNT